jgi:hypothetical protein
MNAVRSISAGALLLFGSSAFAADRKTAGDPHPAKTVERLSKMPPKQRKQVLEKLPPERRAIVERRLEKYEKLGPAEKNQVRKQYDTFQHLPIEKQEALRRLYRRFNTLPEERRAPVGEELGRFRTMSSDERRARMNTDEFRNRYTQPEQQLLGQVARLMDEQQQLAGSDKAKE